VHERTPVAQAHRHLATIDIKVIRGIVAAASERMVNGSSRSGAFAAGH
jgi:hypothetical protein